MSNKYFSKLTLLFYSVQQRINYFKFITSFNLMYVGAYTPAQRDGKEGRKIKQNWTGTENFGIRFV